MLKFADSTMPIRVWISSEDALAVVERGFRVIQVPSNYFYLVSSCVLHTHPLVDHARIVVPVNGWEVTQVGESSILPIVLDVN
jgi:hypothetical protein